MNEAWPFLAGGGEMGARMRAHDWSQTRFGAPDTWPQSLRSVISACLNSPMLGTILWGPDLCMLYNDAYIASMADRHPAALGKPVREVWGAAWDQVSAPFHEAMKTGEGFSDHNVEIPMIRRGQFETTWWHFSAAPIRGENGEIAGLLNQGVEITDQVLGEQALRRLNETLEFRVAERTRDRNRLWELSSDIMLRCGFDGFITAVNPAWKEVLGWDENELVGASLFDLIHPDDMEHTRLGARALSEGTSHRRFDNRYRRKDGTYRWISWSTKTDDASIYAVGRDITVEKAREEALQSAEEALRQSQKMEAVGQLTGGLAHDFNNLLAGITGSLQVMQLRLRQGRLDNVERYVEAAQGAATRAASLTHRLLAFSRRQTLDPKPTDVNRLIRGMEDLIRRTVGPSIEIEVANAIGLWLALVDPSQLENSLLNLCINARDAMPHGGRITIETANKLFDAQSALAHGLAEGHYLSLCVCDNGTGMTPDVISKAFDPFFTTKPIGEGTGLGLSMIYGFAKQSGGQVHIASEVGQGSTVCVYLPRYTGVESSETQTSRSTVLSRTEHRKKILVVDDEPTVRMLLVDVLEELGYDVTDAADSRAGLDILERDAPVDLLVSDVGLPGGMNGRQMADAARVTRAHLKVLFITGYAETAVLGDGQLAPGMAVMTKPFQIDAFAERVRGMIEQNDSF
jgi:PAS domain S-box-containing protein